MPATSRAGVVPSRGHRRVRRRAALNLSFLDQGIPDVERGAATASCRGRARLDELARSRRGAPGERVPRAPSGGLLPDGAPDAVWDGRAGVSVLDAADLLSCWE